MIFITRGKYDVGYMLNKILKLRMTFGERTIVGAFNMCFDQRSIFVYKVQSHDLHGLAIRRRPWCELVKGFPHFQDCMEEKFLNHFDWKLRRPLQAKKDRDIADLKLRSDFQEIMVIEDGPLVKKGQKESGSTENEWFFMKRQELYERNTVNFNKMFENDNDVGERIDEMDEAIDEILEKLPQVNDLIDSVEPGIDGLRDNVKRFLNNKEVRNYQHECIVLR
jgi:hypothetical protein